MLPALAACLAAWESAWWLKRVVDRKDTYARALGHARRIGKPLLVVGAPDAGPTRSPTGDIVLDLLPSRAPVSIQADITKRIPLPDDSVVVFVCCVLEYVSDLDAAMKELRRVAKDRIYIVRVQPWTLTALLYPGGRRTLDASMVRR